MNETEDLAKFLKTISPYDLLKIMNNGFAPSPNQVRIIEDILREFEFKDEVMNVLIEYVIIVRNDFTRNDAFAMAKFLKRKQISSAEQGMYTIREAIKKRNLKRH